MPTRSTKQVTIKKIHITYLFIKYLYLVLYNLKELMQPWDFIQKDYN